jgi:4-hydroxy-tetrahydrodipicolinate synthase
MLDVKKLHGIHAILYALFDQNEALDRLAMRRQTEICIKAGVHGLAALGLATEVSKLSEAERFTVMDWLAEDRSQDIPLCFTIYGSSVAEQTRQIRHAEKAGADWVILQPPMVGAYAAREYIDFFIRVANATSLPVGIQNAPAFLGRSLTITDMIELNKHAANVSIIKGEGPVVDIANLIAATENQFAVLNGRAGLEFTDNLKVGCRGLIIAPDLIDYAVKLYTAHRDGKHNEAEALYRTILPAIVFTMQGVENLICYGKRLFAARAGLTVFDRAPATRSTATGDTMVGNFVRDLGPF